MDGVREERGDEVVVVRTLVFCWACFSLNRVMKALSKSSCGEEGGNG